VQGLNDLQKQEQRKSAAATTCRTSGHLLVDAGDGLHGRADVLVAAVGAWLYWKRKLEGTRWFLRTASSASPSCVAASAGWILTEMGRQPSQGLLKTADATSPNVSTTWLGISLAFFITLYAALGVVDFVLMRHYARPDRPVPRAELPEPAVSY
jgi:cytochrome bd-type quinol oxidase subunit 1